MNIVTSIHGILIVYIRVYGMNDIAHENFHEKNNKTNFSRNKLQQVEELKIISL